MNTLACTKLTVPIQKYELHSHKDWEVILQLSGSNTTLVGDTVYEMSEGCVLILPPDALHSGSSDDNFIDFSIRAKSLPFSGHFMVIDHENDIRFLAEMLSKSFTEKESNYKSISDSLLSAICEYIKKYSETDYKYEFVHFLKNAIYENFGNSDFNISETVKKFGYNIDYVRRCFCEETGKTPHEYLTFLRLNKAKEFLIHEDSMSISAIAENCGFNDCFYFSRIFRKAFGMPPSEYRKKMKND